MYIIQLCPCVALHESYSDSIFYQVWLLTLSNWKGSRHYSKTWLWVHILSILKKKFEDLKHWPGVYYKLTWNGTNLDLTASCFSVYFDPTCFQPSAKLKSITFGQRQDSCNAGNWTLYIKITSDWPVEDADVPRVSLVTQPSGSGH